MVKMPDRTERTATSFARANIAFIKYWGNRDDTLRIPSNGSISMNLDGLTSHTRVRFDPSFRQDTLVLNGAMATQPARQRASALLGRVRTLAGLQEFAQIESFNNFPTGTGIASSASGFAALTLAASRAAGLVLDQTALSRLARTASGSACRSIPGGFVEWQAGSNDLDSYAVSIAPPDHWNLVDCIAIISHTHKHTTSQQGHSLASTSPLQTGRISGASERLQLCRKAILNRDFDTLADVIELDSNMMHAVMMTSNPRLMYWQPATIQVMLAVQHWRKSGIPAAYTIDAGPNVHVICRSDAEAQIVAGLEQISGVERVMTARPGGEAQVINDTI